MKISRSDHWRTQTQTIFDDFQGGVVSRSRVKIMVVDGGWLWGGWPWWCCCEECSLNLNHSDSSFLNTLAPKTYCEPKPCFSAGGAPTSHFWNPDSPISMVCEELRASFAPYGFVQRWLGTNSTYLPFFPGVYCTLLQRNPQVICLVYAPPYPCILVSPYPHGVHVTTPTCWIYVELPFLVIDVTAKSCLVAIYIYIYIYIYV